MKRIAILGSTGSIGINTLRVVENHPKEFQVVALAACRNFEALFNQAKKFRPRVVCLYDSTHALELEHKLKPFKIKVVTGESGLTHLSTLQEADRIVFALVGAAGLRPIDEALKAGKFTAVANKEPLVMAGELLMGVAKKFGGSIVPIDSEHSGLMQCLAGRDPSRVHRLILTSSGGPFRDERINLKKVTKRLALSHPKWKMGPKITIDSATLMNKGLEVIEASNLFGFSPERIKVLIHPEAIVHAIVELIDGSQIAQLGVTDMCLPIQYALTYPGRLINHSPRLDLTQVGSLQFFEPNFKRFPCLELGYRAKKSGGTMPAVLNGANEIAVECFLNDKIKFMQIPDIISRTMRRHRLVQHPSLKQILEADAWAREEAKSLC